MLQFSLQRLKALSWLQRLLLRWFNVLQTVLGQTKALPEIPALGCRRRLDCEENVRVSINICHEPLITVEASKVESLRSM